MENAAFGEMKFQPGLANNLDQTAYHETTLNELRHEFDRVAAEWASLIGEGAARSVRAAKETVQEHPWTAVALAAAIGAIVAIALVPQRQAKQFGRAEIVRNQLLRDTNLVRRPAVDTQPLSTRFAQAWDSIATLNASALPTLSSSTIPSFETFAGLVKSFWTTQSQTKSTP